MLDVEEAKLPLHIILQTCRAYAVENLDVDLRTVDTYLKEFRLLRRCL